MMLRSSYCNLLLKRSRNCCQRNVSSSSSSSTTTATRPSSTALIQNTTYNDKRRIVDLRSDTVTSPSNEMLQTVLYAKTGDDVMGEDITVQELENYVAKEITHKLYGLYVPTGTMANMIALMAHCNIRSTEILIGSQSHIALWEGGNIAGIGNIFSKYIIEDPITGEYNLQQIRNLVNRNDSDPHLCKTQVLCMENTHNMLGGIVLSTKYMNDVGNFCRTELSSSSDLNPFAIHLDGARLCNAAIAQSVPIYELCTDATTISICLSKGLGAPCGSVLVSDNEQLIHLAKRARKRCGGGMRQVGVIAAMGLYAIQNNVIKLQYDHERAQYLAKYLLQHNFHLLRNGQVDTNIIYFQLPSTTETINHDTHVGMTDEIYVQRLYQEYGIKITSGYNGNTITNNKKYFRAVTHLDITDEDIVYAAKSMVELYNNHYHSK